jgi:hypothetical protein
MSKKKIRARRQDFRAFDDVVSVRITSFVPGASFDGHFQACFGEIGNYGGHNRDAPLRRKAFTGNTDDHEAPSDVQELNLLPIGFWPGRIVHRLREVSFVTT